MHKLYTLQSAHESAFHIAVEHSTHIKYLAEKIDDFSNRFEMWIHTIPQHSRNKNDLMIII